jgi:hypothetical protein
VHGLGFRNRLPATVPLPVGRCYWHAKAQATGFDLWSVATSRLAEVVPMQRVPSGEPRSAPADRPQQAPHSEE